MKTKNPVLMMNWDAATLAEEDFLASAVKPNGSHKCEIVRTPVGSYCEVCERLGGSFVKSRRG